MNEFARKALELADMYENSGRCYLSASPKNAERLKDRRAELRAALVAHLEGAEQKPDPGVACNTDGARCSTYVECAAFGCKRPATPTEEQSQ